MKRLFSLLTIFTLIFVQSNQAFPIQDEMEMMEQDSVQTSEMVEMEEPVMEEPVEEEQLNFHQELKKRFIEGGPGFMGIVLLCLILGLAIAIERIIYLNLSTTTDSSKLTSVSNKIYKDININRVLTNFFFNDVIPCTMPIVLFLLFSQFHHN